MCRIAARLAEIDLAVSIAASIPDRGTQIDALGYVIRWLPLGHRLSPATQETLAEIRGR
jgi:hypothetical protein